MIVFFISPQACEAPANSKRRRKFKHKENCSKTKRRDATVLEEGEVLEDGEVASDTEQSVKELEIGTLSTDCSCDEFSVSESEGIEYLSFVERFGLIIAFLTTLFLNGRNVS